MPYIKQELRHKLENSIISTARSLSNLEWKKGNVNFAISTILKLWIQEKGISYDILSDITGVLNDVKTEFERKVVAPYEDNKEKENGEIY